MDTILPGFIKVAADPQLKGNGLQKFLVGENYRREWTEPVKVPILNLKTVYGGLVPEKLGGGKETKSLRVNDGAGRQWAFRSVEKFPENAIPPELRKTIAEKIVKDGISASYPYGILSMSSFSKAANVPFLKDTLVYIPDDPALGEFRSKFKNILVLMEEREPSGVIKEIDPSSTVQEDKKEKTISTEKLIYELANDNNNKIDQSAVLRARLLDNFVMDFDRHEAQWDWLGIDSAGGKIYYPIPIDHDQVFYSSQGLLSKLVSSKNILPETQGFRKKAKDIRTFNKAAQNFDRFFLTALSEDEWSRQIDAFLHSMTDSVIESALHKQPAEIQKYSAKKIITTLKKKRKYFEADMMRYYRFLSKTVSIVGSNEQEEFTISKKENGTVSVVINKTDSSENISSKIYERTFDPAITKEIRIYGLEGDDKFVLQGGASKIKIRLIGGPGNDEFINNGNGRKIMAYDVRFEKNIFSGDQNIHKKISNDPQNNNYTRLGYLYDNSSPGISLEYSFDGGLYIGPKLKIVKQGFRKEPYSMSHLFAVNWSLNSPSYHIKYNADFVKLFGKTDLLIRSDAMLPTSRTHFFGVGNNTVFDKTKPGGHKYYFARYDLVNISVMARNNINPWFQIKYGPVFQYFKLRSKENENRYISMIYPDEGSSKEQYSEKSFAGGEFGLEINTKNDLLIPTRGVNLNIYTRSLGGLNNFSHHVTQTGGDLSLFTDFISKKHVVIATSFGVSHISGKYELEQAQYLGFKQNLRGFRIDRFAGRSRVYNNTELRFIKSGVNFGLFRGSFGLLVFNDVGRVWADNERSTAWHDGYGWGIWIAPLNRLVVTASLMYSKEEKNLALINLGFQF
ncbi:MAG TPA: BamA/TamA family outer membrane protein [Chitinophagaceae bacterium]|nr:BamA/TamA family outer membrane protein [Chitinophagaceae bacterium]